MDAATVRYNEDIIIKYANSFHDIDHVMLGSI
jgi:hypothetical protein